MRKAPLGKRPAVAALLQRRHHNLAFELHSLLRAVRIHSHTRSCTVEPLLEGEKF